MKNTNVLYFNCAHKYANKFSTNKYYNYYTRRFKYYKTPNITTIKSNSIIDKLYFYGLYYMNTKGNKTLKDMSSMYKYKLNGKYECCEESSYEYDYRKLIKSLMLKYSQDF